MPEVVVTPLPEGAARSRDVYLLGGFDGGSLQQSGRGGTAGAGANSTNWGYSGEGTTYLNNYGGSWIYRQRGGAFQVFNTRIPIQTTRPPFRVWYPLPALHVVYLLMAWPNNNAFTGTDNGLILSYANNPQVVGGAGQGFQIGNNAGVVTLWQRGAALTSVNLSGAAGFTAFNPQTVNLFRVELRQPTSIADGSLEVFVNDDNAPRATVTTAQDWPTAVGGSAGMMIGMGAASSADFVYFRDVGYFCGPDTRLGM